MATMVALVGNSSVRNLNVRFPLAVFGSRLAVLHGGRFLGCWSSDEIDVWYGLFVSLIFSLSPLLFFTPDPAYVRLLLCLSRLYLISTVSLLSLVFDRVLSSCGPDFGLTARGSKILRWRGSHRGYYWIPRLSPNGSGDLPR